MFAVVLVVPAAVVVAAVMVAVGVHLVEALVGVEAAVAVAVTNTGQSHVSKMDALSQLRVSSRN